MKIYEDIINEVENPRIGMHHLVHRLREQGHQEQDVRTAVWDLIDRGQLKFERDWSLTVKRSEAVE